MPFESRSVQNENERMLRGAVDVADRFVLLWVLAWALAVFVSRLWLVRCGDPLCRQEVMEVV